MARYNLIKIGTKYLTSTGLVGGIAHATEIDNIHLLLLTNVGPVVKAITGVPYKFGREQVGEGVDIVIRLLTPWDTTRRDEIANELDVAANTTVNVTIVGPSGNLDLDVIPGEPAIIHDGRTRTGRVYGASINFTVKEIN